MSISKTIKFYQFEPQPSLANNGLTPMTISEILKTIFPKCCSYSIIYEKDKYIIDIMEISSDFLFGKCAKENEVHYTSFYQTRDKHTMEATPYTSFSPDTQLEVYTYFFISYSQQRMAALQHKNITKIQYILSEGIWELSKNTLKVFIAPEKIKDIKKTAKKIKRSKKLSVSFAPDTNSKYNIDSLAKSLGDIQYDSFHVEIKLSQDNSDLAINRIYENYAKDKDAFNSLKLSGKNDTGLEETIDFIETLFTHTTQFDIAEDNVINSDIIKKELSDSLNIKQ